MVAKTEENVTELKPRNRPMVMVSDLIAGSRQLDVVIRDRPEDEGGEVLGIIEVVYNPKAMTAEVERSFIELGRAKGNGAAQTAVKLILATVKKWDLQNEYPKVDALGDPELDDDGQPVMEVRTVPLTADALSELSAAITGPVMMAIVQDMNPKARGRNGKGTPATIQAHSPSTSD
jgi:hypothetical protein